MQTVFWLAVGPRDVRAMYKGRPTLHRGEIAVKVTLVVKPGAFREPTIEQTITIEDWHEGIDLGDVELKSMTITEKEAEQIRNQRRAALVQMVRDLGYEVTSKGEDHDEHSDG